MPMPGLPPDVPSEPPRPASGPLRIGLGLAAVGRPGYINLGRDHDLPRDRTVAAMRHRCHELLDAAYAQGVRRLDAARSYGLSEQFLAEWLDHNPRIHDLTISSKWGYTYTADWSLDAEAHEVKDHGRAAFERQLAETRALLGDRLDLYQVHSVTPGGPLFTDAALRRALSGLAAGGTAVGISTSGPDQATAVRDALGLTVDGEPLVSSVQVTWNVLEPSAGPALAEAHAAGRRVIVKEAMANGRLARPGPGTALTRIAEETGASYDAVALAAVLHQPWAGTVLSGAATTAQLTSNLGAAGVRLAPDQTARLAAMAEPAPEYWARRSRLPWT